MNDNSPDGGSGSSQANATGFWSYVRMDDSDELGRISQLARDVVRQYEMLTGETINLFIDRDDIKWGDKYRKVIDGSLASVKFFIPVMTPRYFMHKECIRELEYFAKRAKELGITELILPLHYVEVPELIDDSEKEGVLGMISEFQYRDWRDIRFSDTTSEVYRREVSAIAALVQANKTADQAVFNTDTAEESEKYDEYDEDSKPGTLDLLAGSERAFPEFIDTVNRLGEQTSIIGEILTGSRSRIEKASGFRNRVLEVRNVAMKLRAPTANIEGLRDLYKSQLKEIDEGLRVIIEQAPGEIETNPETKRHFCDLFTQIIGLSSTAEDTHVSIQDMIDACAHSR